MLVTIDDFTGFKLIRDFPPEDIIPEVLTTVRNLDEREELEPLTTRDA